MKAGKVGKYLSLFLKIVTQHFCIYFIKKFQGIFWNNSSQTKNWEFDILNIEFYGFFPFKS